jgi:hypothetical protein
VLLLMAATSLAVLAFFQRDPSHERWWRRRLAPAIATLVLTAVAVGSVAQFHILLGVPATAPVRWVFPAGYAVLIGLGLAWAAVLRRTRPEIYRAVGLGANSASRPSARVADLISSS